MSAPPFTVLLLVFIHAGGDQYVAMNRSGSQLASALALSARMYAQWRRTHHYPEGIIVYDTNDSAFLDIPLLPRSPSFGRNTRGIPVLLDWAWGPRRLRRERLYVFDHEQTSTAIAEAAARHIASHGLRIVRVFIDKDDILTRSRHWWMFTHLLKLRAALTHFCSALDYRMYVVQRRPQMPRDLPAAPEFVHRAERELSRYRRTNLDSVRHEIVYADTLDECFEAARERQTWVFQRDRHAAEALDWAHRRRLHVPANLAVIGLENDPAFYHRGLSRVDPDWSSMGYMMAHALIGDFAVPTGPGRVIETRARVVEKLTT
ncbi:MAG: hypothetical protein GF331_21265 [Chitinivibrionales bacterium]|nr:hypothetical protein [Chitinivibrionales bacterium]